MTTFTITGDFPKWEVEFYALLSDPKACCEYLFKQNGWGRLSVKDAGINTTGTVNVTFTFAPKCQHQNSLTAGTIMDSSKLPITHWFKAM